jgi:hypothetical protein
MINSDLLKEINSIQQSEFAKKSDKQLNSYEILAQLKKGENKGIQPQAFKFFNDNRKRKLSVELIEEIKNKYNPYVYGKLRLAKEYGVSKSLIHKLLKSN